MESNISQGETGSSHTQEKEEGAAAALREETRKVEEKELLAATAAATPQEEMEGENLPVFLCPGRVDLRVLPNWFQKEHLENPAVCDVPAWQVEKIFGTEGKDIPGIEQSTETLLQVQILDPKGMARISIFGSQEKKELVEANIYCQRRWLHVVAEKEKLVEALKIVNGSCWQEIPRLPGPFPNPDADVSRK
ncbi:oocyte-expressed protein homolog [Loxodonta africana]|uniref:oocyte-expressed protein homolog n=1 Tax=Elephas maximus indicus TaxID=99487 RepID=UPI00211633D9|nr:oocyte-expressed protein homolog [Elephas maximus indicus]